MAGAEVDAADEDFDADELAVERDERAAAVAVGEGEVVEEGDGLGVAEGGLGAD